MKKTYILPQMEVEIVETEQMMAQSQFDSTKNSQSIKLTDEEYSGEFCVKEFDTSFWE